MQHNNIESGLIFEQYSKVQESLGLGPAVPKMMNMPAIGSTSEAEEKEAKCTCGECPECRSRAAEEDEIFIQAGQPEMDSEIDGCCTDDGSCGEDPESSEKAEAVKGLVASLTKLFELMDEDDEF